MAGAAEILSQSEVSREAVLIFLTVGSWYRGFDRLVTAVDSLKETGEIAEEVVAQIGPGKYRPKHFSPMDFCSPDEFNRIVGDARLVIGHAGLGTIAVAIRQQKPIIVVPRKPSLGEISDDHQFLTAEQLEAEGKILVAREVGDLPARLQEAKSFVPVASTGSQDICRAVEAFIEEVVAEKCR
jgi:exopolysaccharide biosynthesis glucuronosyltransferase PssE